MKNKIVILGAGYAGIFLCTNLSSKLKDTSEIILIDRNDYHQLMQEIHLVASGFRTDRAIKNSDIFVDLWKKNKIYSI